ncbi:hypothetical protein GCM10009118_25410 [Wandonia haliotis]|uniref:Uncharacterized protein n=2 Tax=Wandonia haliotis TaxID=574963 RepID=A0ABN1MT55_9FLAO
MILSVGYGQTEVYTNQLTGVLTPGEVCVSQDEKYNFMESNPTSWTSSFKNLAVENKVSLQYDPTVELTGGVYENTTVGVNITWKDENFVSHTRQETLEIEYDPNGAIVVTDRSTYFFTGGHEVELKIVSLGGNMPNASVILKNEITVERGYLFSGMVPLGIGIDATSETDYVTFYWTAVTGATHYELEFVHINDYTETENVFKNPSLLTYDFYRNSTRVEVFGTTYRIPKLFDHGYLIFRLRGVGRQGINYEHRKEGAWSASESGIISSFPSEYKLVITSEVEGGKKNWVHSVGYTEEGKRFESVGFADGLGRGRQQIARNTETAQAIVSNVYYDYHGRPVVSDLGTPVDGESLAYYESFNRPESNPLVNYGPAFFDKDADPMIACIPQSEGFSQNYGSGQYYSVNNPDKERENAYIPDAKGFPFARIQYMPDQTGRIKRAGAYGEEFQIGSGHETEFFYVIPSQEELNLLFGTDVGINTHYQKRVMRDANGQHYVEYYDMAGRVIASALLGNKPTNLLVINDVGAVSMTVNMINGIDENNPPVDGVSQEVQHIFFDTDAEVAFNYGFTPGHFSSFCQESELCFDCVYELTLTVKDDCGEIVLSEQRFVNGSELENLQSYTLDESCSTASADYVFTDPFIVETGVYVISKELRIATEVIPDYWCMEVNSENCTTSYFDFFNGLYNNAVFDVCEQVFEPAPFNPAGASCDDFLAIMNMDVSPNGQYGQYQQWSGGVYTMNPSLFDLSVFNTSNSLSGNWKDNTIVYMEEDGVTPSYITVFDDGNGGYTPQVSNPALITTNGFGQTVTVPQNLLNFEDFISEWKSSWANALVVFHPEYCYYTFCTSQQASHDYDHAMRSVIEQKDACGDHWYNPLNLTSADPLSFFPNNFLRKRLEFTNVHLGIDCTSGNPVIDPFFQTYPGSVYYSDMLSDLQNYTQNQYGDPYTITEIAIWSVVFPNESLDNPWTIRLITEYKGEDFCLNDQIWLNYVSMYQAIKKKYYYLAEQQYALDNGCYNGCIGNPTFSPTAVIDHAGGTYNSLKTDPQPCNTPGDYSSKHPRFQSSLMLPNLLQDGSSLYTDLQSQVDDAMEQMCVQLVSDWTGQLSLCGFTSSQLSQVETELSDLCNSLSAVNNNQFVTLDFYGEVHTILTNVLGSGYETNLCSPLLLTKPEIPSTGTNDMTLDDCGCDKLMTARYEWQQNPLQYANKEEVLYDLYGIRIPDIDDMLCACDKAFGAGWTPGAVWSGLQMVNLENEEQVAPGNLACTRCIGCTEFDAAASVFASRFTGITENSVNYGKLLTHFMNDRFKLALQYGNYREFAEACNTTVTEPECELSEEAEALTAVLDLIARRGQLSLSPSTTIDLIQENVVYAQTYGKLETPSLYQRFSIQPGALAGELILHFEDPQLQTSCNLTLQFPEDNSFGIEQVIGFANLQPLGDGCTDDRDFTIQVYYVDCGQIAVSTITGNSGCVSLLSCVCDPSTAQLCNTTPILSLEDMPWQEACYEPDLGMLIYQATQAYEQHVEEQRIAFYEQYMATCSQAFETEVMEYSAPFNSYQHTLFYYDQAGNLVQTVAPEGRDRNFIQNDATTQSDVNTARLAGTPRVVPDHTFITSYGYNSYNQLVTTTNPDQEGDTRFWYDFYGRIAASQNPHQASLGYLSYTLYDKIGRPVEVGLIKNNPPAESILKVDDKGSAFESWVTSSYRMEITRTQYDKPLNSYVESKFANGQQEHLRMRVASVMYYPVYQSEIGKYQSAVHYSYDVHGNVKEVIQDMPLDGLPTENVSTQYEYELLSGNMKKVLYQAEKIDQHTQTYTYDALNRLTEVHSSTDAIHYHREAGYSYYDYGPLARKEIGSARVQGQDFMYTINGWLKGMNSNMLDKSKDPGKDGTVYPTGLFAARNLRVAKDVVGFSLGYFDRDYDPIGGIPAEATYMGTNFGNGAPDLFNGNIRHMVTAIEGMEVQGYAYRYDQLQRLIKVNTYRKEGPDFDWNHSYATEDYGSHYKYDRNGNLLSLERNGFGSEVDMDRFSYGYYILGGKRSNRLSYVVDDAIDHPGYDDIKPGQVAGNYVYNKIGELTEDASEGILLDWRLGDHKLSGIKRMDADSPELEFYYNPFGQRILKVEKPRQGGNVINPSQWKYTYYSYDANGQVMGVYTANPDQRNYQLDERHLYGAERLGINGTPVKVIVDGNLEPFAHKRVDVVHTDQRGNKRYELTNHLGNVLAVINDRKMWNVTDGDYDPVLLSWSDYYAFGMTMPGRNGGVDYRYQFNGMEHDGELSGNGNSYTTEFRQYDPRLGRWKSLDPLMADYPEMSPYTAFNNNPIYFIDPEGLEGGPARKKLELPTELPPDDISNINSGGGIRYGESFGEKVGNWIRVHVLALFNKTVRENLNQAKQNDQVTYIKLDKDSPALRYGGVFEQSDDEDIIFWKYSIRGGDESLSHIVDDKHENITQNTFKEKKLRMTRARDKYRNKKNRSNKVRWGFSFSLETKSRKFHFISIAIGRNWKTHNMIFTRHKEARKFTDRSFTPLFGIKWKTKLGTYNWIYIGKAIRLRNGRTSNWVWDLSKKRATSRSKRRKARKRN